MRKRFSGFVLLAATSVRMASAATVYVAASSPTDGPGTSWGNAFHHIQAGIDVATNAGDIVLVNDGHYYEHLTITNAITVKSVNGSGATVIDVSPAYSHAGVTITASALLVGFAVTNGTTGLDGGTAIRCTFSGNINSGGNGGGAAHATLDHCTFSGNYADNGGAAYACELRFCTIAGNLAGGGGGLANSTGRYCTITGNQAGSGGGAYDSVLDHCTLNGNNATSGGGAYGSGAAIATLRNCALYGNTCNAFGNGFGAGACGNTLSPGTYPITLENCTVANNLADNYGGGCNNATVKNCIVVSNESGFAIPDDLQDSVSSSTFTSADGDPLFVGSGSGNFRLQGTSPCINAGNNADAPLPDDRDGLPRIVNSTVDQGAYEYTTNTDSDADGLPNAWELQYGGHGTNFTTTADDDSDTFSNYAEYLAGTDPADPLSLLAFGTGGSASGAGVFIRWQSATGRLYRLMRSANLQTDAFTTTIATNIAAAPPGNTATDTTAVGQGPWYYQVRLEP